MTQSFQLGTLANMITANGSTNVVTVSNSLIITGQATVSGNLNINSTSDIVFDTAAGISANGSLGTSGQALTTNGTAVYWATVAAGTNVAAQYTWTNTNIFQANVTVNNFFAQTKISIGAAAGYDHGALAVLEIDASQNTYVQSVIQNANSGTNASGDLIITNNIGNDSVNYVDLGINSSTYSNTQYTVVGANDAYLYTSNGALGIGTASAKDVIFHANGTLTTNEVMRMGANTRITVANTLVVNGDLLFNSGYGSAATAYGCRAWVNFNGTGTVAIRASGNVSSITDTAVGKYTVNFTNALPDANYVAIAEAPTYTNTNGSVIGKIAGSATVGSAGTMTTTALAVVYHDNGNGFYDPAMFFVAIIR